MTDKLIVITGPTASGKSALGVALAKKFDGEVVSADSRQVYKGLNIGAGKITQKEMRGIPHHLLDVASPRRKFTVAQYQKLAFKAIRDIQRRGKVPLLVGGTPFYVYALVDNLRFPEVKPNPKLRADLEKLSAEQLLLRLKKLDPERVNTLRQSSGQEKNKRRLVRALEIVMSTGKPVPKVFEARLCTNLCEAGLLLIGVKRSPEELKKRIHKRLLHRINHGMVNEVRNLHAQGLSWKRLEEFGLEYRDVAQYLQRKLAKEEMIERIQKESEDFARRQMLWFKRDPRIRWISSFTEAKRLVVNFLR